jgi:queuine tRNA-ribosyltransferase
MEIQRTIGADIIMAFDECTPYPCDYRYAQRSMKMTHRWLDRCVSHLESASKYGYDKAFLLYKEAVTKTYASNQRNISPIVTK